MSNQPLTWDVADERMLEASIGTATYLAKHGQLTRLKRLQERVNGLVAELERDPSLPPPARPLIPYEGATGGP